MNKYTRAELIIRLRDTISKEVEKPEDEIDFELVDACLKQLAELMGERTEFSSEKLDKRLAEIMAAKTDVDKVKRKSRFALKSIMEVACVALVLISASFAVGAFNPSMRNMVHLALEQTDGGTLEEAGVSYKRMDVSKTYSSISELVDGEGLDIAYPHIMPDGVGIEKVLCDENSDEIIIIFNNEALWMQIFDVSAINIDEMIRNTTASELGGHDVYIMKIDDKLSAYAIIDDHIYVVAGDNEETIETIFNGLYKEKNYEKD